MIHNDGMQSVAEISVRFPLLTGLARTFHLVLGLGLILVLYFTFGVCGFTAVYTPVGRAAFEIGLWSVLAALLLGHWIWAGVFVYGPPKTGEFQGTTWLLGAIAVAMLAIFLPLESYLLLHFPKEQKGAALFPAFAGPFVLVILGSAIVSKWLDRTSPSLKPMATLMVVLALVVPAMVAVAFAVLAPGDAVYYLLLPHLGMWFGTLLCIGLHIRARRSSGSTMG